MSSPPSSSPAQAPSPLPRLSLDQLAQAFLDLTLPRAQWTHEAHLRVGAWHVHRFGAALALPHLREGICRLNLAHGGANTATGGYHETITAAYVRLIADFLARDADDARQTPHPRQTLDAQVQRLLASPLAEKDTLLRFWSRALLMSPPARAGWVPPDLAPLPPSPDAGAR